MTEKELEKFLSQFKKRIKASENLAQRIVADLEIKEIREREKGRLSGYELIFNQIHNLMTKWKIIVPVAVIVLAIIIWGIVQFSPRGPVISPELGQPTGGEYVEYVEEEYVKAPPEVPVPQVSGNIDDLVDAMAAFSENEMVIIVEEGNDAALVTIDSQAISDFGQSYDEDELQNF